MEKVQRTVLVIDNDESVLDAIAVRLADQGMGCITALTGTQGLQEFRENSVDLVITDLNMPGYDGISLAETIRSTSQIPIILMTAYPSSYTDCTEHLSRTLMLTKPFAWNTMLDLIETEFALSSS